MTHPYDRMDYRKILDLCAGQEAANHALLAHHMRGEDRWYHVRMALAQADKVAEAAAALRAEVERIEAAKTEAA